MKTRTEFTLEIHYPLDELRKVYARYIGENNWRKIKRLDIDAWVGSLAQSGIESGLDQALKDFCQPNNSGK